MCSFAPKSVLIVRKSQVKLENRIFTNWILRVDFSHLNPKSPLRKKKQDEITYFISTTISL